MVENGALLIDVRAPHEYKSVHISGAINMPLMSFEKRISEISAQQKDKTKPIIVYCNGVGRAHHAKKLLKKHGFKKVINLGGWKRWPTKSQICDGNQPNCQ